MESRARGDLSSVGITAIALAFFGSLVSGVPAALAEQRGSSQTASRGSSTSGRPGRVDSGPSRPGRYPYPRPPQGYPFLGPPVPIFIPSPIFVATPPPMIFSNEFYGTPAPSGGGLGLPSPNASGVAQQPRPRAALVKRADPAKGADLVKIGDRLFRAGNTKRAEERYLQAIKADPNSAAPYLRMAQLALTRGKFSEAAEQFRAAQTAEPGWLVNAIDIQTIYAEPSDFAEVVTKLESHVQAHPGDRDAWLALGAQFFLSGRVRQSADIFQRLADRKVDETLAAFIDASTPIEPARPEPAQP